MHTREEERIVDAVKLILRIGKEMTKKRKKKKQKHSSTINKKKKRRNVCNKLSRASVFDAKKKVSSES